MAGQFARNGIRFQYPENWARDEQKSESGWTVAVQSPNTAFLLLSFDENMPPIDQVLQTTIDALRTDYSDLEVYDRVDTLAGHPAIGHDMQFTSLDLTNTCVTRSFYTGDGTVLLMWQAADLDLEESRPVLDAICASIEVDEEHE